jgi:D-sedoheptulose 7-phosphate isomerase
VTAGHGPAGAGSIEELYPFLYAGQSDLSSVLDQVRESTVAKTAEILRLRQQVLVSDGARLVQCAEAMADRFAAGGRLLAFGNGGSATDAQQLVTLFMHPAADRAAGQLARPIPALGLASDPSVLTALCNDIGVDVVYARQLAAFGSKADVAIGLSTSGNSDNMLRAFDEASRRGMLTVGLAGYAGGRMAELDSIDYLFIAPSSSVHRIQEAQTTIYHALWDQCQSALAPSAGVRPGGTGS